MIEECPGIVSEIWRTPVFVLISLWNVMEPEARSFWNLFVPGAAQTRISMWQKLSCKETFLFCVSQGIFQIGKGLQDLQIQPSLGGKQNKF